MYLLPPVSAVEIIQWVLCVCVCVCARAHASFEGRGGGQVCSAQTSRGGKISVHGKPHGCTLIMTVP